MQHRIKTFLPSSLALLLMLVMIVFFFRLKDAPAVRSMLSAVRPVVIGLLLWTAYDMAASVFGAGKAGWGRAIAVGWDKALIAIGAFAVLVLTRLNPIYLVAGAALAGLAIYR